MTYRLKIAERAALDLLGGSYTARLARHTRGARQAGTFRHWKLHRVPERHRGAVLAALRTHVEACQATLEALEEEYRKAAAAAGELEALEEEYRRAVATAGEEASSE